MTTPPVSDAAVVAVAARLAELYGPILGNDWAEDARQMFGAALPHLGQTITEWGVRTYSPEHTDVQWQPNRATAAAWVDRINNADPVHDPTRARLVFRQVTEWTEAP